MMETMRPAEVEAVIRFARAGLVALSERALSWAAFAGALAVFGYSIYAPEWTRAACAAGYAILVLWPILRLESSKQPKE